MLAVDKENTLLLSGNGDVIEPDDGLAGIGSGGPFALAAARALMAHSDLSAREIAEAALNIAAGYLHLHQPQHRHRRALIRSFPCP